MGRYSSALPARVLENYEAGLKDPKINELEDELAVSEAIGKDILRRMEKGEAGATWDKLFDLKRAYENSYDPDEKQNLLNQLFKTIDRGKADRDARAEFREWIKLRKELAEANIKIKVQMNQMVHLSSVLALVAKIGILFERFVKDAELRQKMKIELGNIINIDPVGIAVAPATNILTEYEELKNG